MYEQGFRAQISVLLGSFWFGCEGENGGVRWEVGEAAQGSHKQRPGSELCLESSLPPLSPQLPLLPRTTFSTAS